VQRAAVKMLCFRDSKICDDANLIVYLCSALRYKELYAC
jgi:hypothetical protein